MTTIHIELVGGDKAVADLDAIGERMIHAAPAFTQIAHVLEQGEQRVFERLGGKFVRTGDTMRSLTQANANDAIREIHSDGAGLTFGSGIWYAHFLKKPASKKSAVLVLEPKARKQARQVLLDWIMGRGA